MTFLDIFIRVESARIVYTRRGTLKHSLSYLLLVAKPDIVDNE